MTAHVDTVHNAACIRCLLAHPSLTGSTKPPLSVIDLQVYNTEAHSWKPSIAYSDRPLALLVGMVDDATAVPVPALASYGREGFTDVPGSAMAQEAAGAGGRLLIRLWLQTDDMRT